MEVVSTIKWTDILRCTFYVKYMKMREQTKMFSSGALPSKNIQDLTFLLSKIFSSPKPNRCFQATDTQCDYTWSATILTYQEIM